VAGVTGTLAGSRAGEALELDINRWRYRAHALLFAAVAIVLVIFVVGAKLPAFGAAFLLVIAAVQVAGLLSALKILSLADPVLIIDERGVFDKRVTREVVPWHKIRGVEVFHVYWSAVRVDVGNRRQAGIALAPWTYFASIRYGTIAWDDIVINPQGLRKMQDRNDNALAERIAAHIKALRARFARPQQQTV
jgi:hypothetical protein